MYIKTRYFIFGLYGEIKT